MTGFAKKVQSTMKSYGMAGGGIVCGLSGGADSVALLLSLLEISGEEGFSLCAVHVDHGLRGEESDRDREFSIALCRRLGVDISVRKVDVRALSHACGIGTEEAARQLRYDAFYDVCREKNAAAVATAHTLSDSCETVLFNLIRGTALKGLCGIPPVRESGGIRIFRPLIEITREEVEDYLADRGESFVTDSTNLTDDYTRNRIRHLLIPAIKEINPAFERSVLRMTDSLRIDEGYLSAALPAGDEISADLPRAVLLRKISALLLENGGEADFSRIRRIETLCKEGGKAEISRGVFAVSDGKTLRIERPAPPTPPFEAPLEIGENAFLCEKRVIADEISVKTYLERVFVNKKFANECIDCGKIQGKAVLRNRREGDRIRLLGRGHTSKVKKLLSENIPRGERDSLVMIADDCGVIFIEGFGVAERAAADQSSERVIHIDIGLKGE